MMKTVRTLAVAAAFNLLVVGVGVAAAQTVIVRHAPPASTVELVLNAATIGSATVDAAGDATLAVNLSEHGGKAETDANVYVDVCGSVRRVLIAERAVQPPAGGPGCTRTQIAGLFWLRKISTLVVDVGTPGPRMWLSQGPAPKQWLVDSPDDVVIVRRSAPKGLVVFGGAGMTKLRDTVAISCGNVAECAGDGLEVGYAVGVAYWVARFLAAEGTFMKPADANASGSGTGFRFDSALDSRLMTIAAKVGPAIGPVRVYGKVGMNYHRAAFRTTQTNDETTITVDNVTQTVKGGTQTFELRTSGWGWLFGAGGEGWITNRFAIYGEAGRAVLKGDSVGGGQGLIDDAVTFVLFGARVRVGR